MIYNFLNLRTSVIWRSCNRRWKTHTQTPVDIRGKRRLWEYLCLYWFFCSLSLGDKGRGCCSASPFPANLSLLRRWPMWNFYWTTIIYLCIFFLMYIWSFKSTGDTPRYVCIYMIHYSYCLSIQNKEYFVFLINIEVRFLGSSWFVPW